MSRQPITIRQLGPEDATLLDRARPSLGLSDDPDAAWRFLSARANTFLAAIAGGEIVGYAYGTYLLDPKRAPSFFLVEVEVDEGLRRQGIASRLVEKMRDAAADLGCAHFWLMSAGENAAAAALYRKLGADESERKTWVWEV